MSPSSDHSALFDVESKSFKRKKQEGALKANPLSELSSGERSRRRSWWRTRDVDAGNKESQGGGQEVPKIMFPSTGPLLPIGLCYLPEIWKLTRSH